jgi:uncharacterized membrane protein
MKSLAKLILTGALTVLPLLATGYMAFWLFNLIEESFGLPVKWAIGDDRYADGMGLALAAVVFLLTGILMRTPPFRRLFGGAERLLLSIPVVKSVYGALRDFFSLFARKKGEESLQVVEVEIPGTDMRLLGFVTRTEFTDVPDGVGGKGDVAVYLPMSYQIGGYTVFMPRKRVRQVDMSREDAMRFVLMAGLKAKPLEKGRTGKTRLKPLACTVGSRSATRSLNRVVRTI